MKKRIIGGTTYVTSVFLLMIFKIYVLAIIFFLITGLYELIEIYKKKEKKEIYLLVYLMIFLGGIYSLYILNKIDVIYVFILMSITMLNDTFAFFVGKKYGKTKFSKTSPNKTLEGIYGGIFFTELIFIGFMYLIGYRYNLMIFSELNIIINVLIICLVLVVADIGDLLESNLKRIYCIKDSGTIVYGHGGILDRIDSLLTSSIVFLIILKFII